MEIKEKIDQSIVTELLRDALFGKKAHVSIEKALEGLLWRQAGTAIPNAPHTIWQQIKHLCYWQDRFISRIEGMKVLPAKSSEEGWCWAQTPVDESEYTREVGKLLTGISYIEETMLHNPACLITQKGDYPNGYAVIQAMGSHLSYHAGEIVLLRRMLGAWPPPSGGYTW